jgi:hypothetical protein
MLREREKLAAVNARTGWRIQNALGASLLLISMIINALGATEHATSLWNIRPVDVDQQPARIWDWRHPQFLAKWQ